MRILVISVALSCGFFLPSAGHAEIRGMAANYEFVDIAVGVHSNLGRGILMAFMIDGMPKGGVTGSLLRRDMIRLCKEYAPMAIAQARKSHNFSKPPHLNVQVRYGTKEAGLYVSRFFTIEGDGCGKVAQK